MSRPDRREPTVPPLCRREAAWMAAIAGAAAAAFATTLSSTVSLGDAPESVAGVSAVGILHAPGYPAYVLAARLFSLAVPIGPLALRVNLFSVLSAVLVVVGAFRVARVLGASRPGAAVGAAALALGTSFWFYADFAKHDAFSLLLVVAATVLIVEWEHRRDRRLLIAGCAVLGLTVGASWQLGALAVPGLTALVVLGRRRDSLAKLLATAVVAGLVASAGMLGYLMIRAGQEPPLNWGDAASTGRVVDLLDMKDFSYVNRRLVGLAANGGPKPASGEQAGLLGRLANYPALLTREMGVAALGVAGWGALRWHRRLALPHATFLAVTFVIGVLGTAVFIGPASVNGFSTNLIVGGFLGGLFFLIALVVALGVTDLVDAAAEVAGRRPKAARSRGGGRRPPARARSRGGGRRPPAQAQRRPATGHLPVVVRAGAGPVAAVGLAAVLLVPAAVIHRGAATQRQPPFADDYAANVFQSLPPHAAILTRGGELTFSLLYAQLVEGHRRDVTVVAADSLAASTWYRGQLSRRIGLRLPDLASQGAELVAVAHRLQARGPVYMDMLTTDALRPGIGYVARGLVSEVVDGVGAQLPASTDAVEQELDHGYRTRGVYDGGPSQRWPNTLLLQSYVRAHLELARDYNQAAQLDAVEAQVNRALMIDPRNPTALGILKALAAARAQAAPSG